MADPLDAAEAALARGDLGEVGAIVEPLARAGDAEALAVLALADAQDGDTPESETVMRLEAAAAAGASRAAFALGQAYQAGTLGLIADPARAAEAYGEAVRLGHPRAEVALIGVLTQGGADAVALRTRLEGLASQGAPGADVLLARMLAEGAGGAPDPQRARQIAEIATEAGRPDAARLLAWMHLQGVGGAPDPDRALDLLRAAAQTDPAAANDLGLLHRDGGAGLRRDTGRAAIWFQTASDLGDAWAPYHLARLLSVGGGVVADDPARAARLMALGDRRGVAAASHRLALMLWDGVGVPADLPAARAAMERAVARAYPLALNDLGAMVEGGIGAPSDPDAAAELYRRAAEAGDVLGAWNLADLLLRAEGTSPERAEGYAWCLWAEQQGDPSDRPLDCTAIGARLTAADRAAGVARVSGLISGRSP